LNNQNEILQVTISALLAVFGALSRLLSQKDKVAVKIPATVSGCFVAAFAGVLANFVSDYLSLSLSLTYLLAGVCGWIGPQVLDAFASIVMKKIQ